MPGHSVHILNLMQVSAAMMTRSTHCEMFVIGSCAVGGGVNTCR